MKIIEDPLGSIKFRCARCLCLFEAYYSECEPYEVQTYDIDTPTGIKIGFGHDGPFACAPVPRIKLRCNCPKCGAVCVPVERFEIKVERV